MENNIEDFFTPSFVEMQTQKFYMDFVHKKNEIIKAALEKHGFDYANIISNIEQIKEDFLSVTEQDGIYEHFYYRYGTPEQIRIISFEKEPFIDFGFNDGLTYKQTVTCKYY